MTPRRDREFDIGHPAPARGAVGPWRLAVALGGAFAVWSVQIGLGGALGGLACLDPEGARSWIGQEAALRALVALDVAAVALGVWAMAIALSNLRRTRREHAWHGGVMDAGEGRTRFLSVWGVWTSGLFLLAILFNAAVLLGRLPCP